MTDVLGAFGVRPSAVIGYSLGEATGLFAMRAWKEGMRDEMLKRMDASTLFTSDLTGKCDAARKLWGLKAKENADWVVGVVNRTEAVVRKHLRGRVRVYLLIVNTPGECVIGGARREVERLVVALGCGFREISGVVTVHCDVARGMKKAYRELHLLEVASPLPEGVEFYSSALGEAYKVTREAAVESIVRQAVAPFDFSAVVRRAYADGVRIFVEIGPGASCTRMIGQILGEVGGVDGEKVVARSVCAAGAGGDGVGSLLRLLGQLVAEGVAVDLGAIYGGGGEGGEAVGGRW